MERNHIKLSLTPFGLNRGDTFWGANFQGWNSTGNVLCVGADLDNGRMVAFSKHGNADTSSTVAWRIVYSAGLQAGESVGVGLFPAFSGGGGARIRCNVDTMRYAPSSGGFMPAGTGLADVQVSAVATCMS